MRSKYEFQVCMTSTQATFRLLLLSFSPRSPVRRASLDSFSSIVELALVYQGRCWNSGPFHLVGIPPWNRIAYDMEW